MAVWTWPITDLVTGVIQHENLPVKCDNFTDYVGVGEGQINFKVPINPATGLNYDDLTDPLRRVIWPCKNGRPMGCYVMTAETGFDNRSRELSMTGKRIDHIFDRREFWSTLVFRDVDQLVIARNIMAYALGLTPLNVAPNSMGTLVTLLPAQFRIPWLHLDNSYSGVPRTREDTSDGYQAATHKSIGDALTKLTELENGFEYRLDYGRDPTTGELTATVVLGYPTVGEVDPITFEFPGNVSGFTYARDSSDMATAWRGFGAGQGAEKVMGAPYYDAAATSWGYPGLQGSSNSTASNLDTVNASARAQLTVAAKLNAGLVVTLDSTVLGQYPLGSSTSVKLEHPRWGTLRRDARIVGHRVEPSRQGRAERVTPSLLFT